MPEIKNVFTSGRMNKDLDERAIPKNEYRDALNIQVSTSDGSDVGTLQNISGNQQISLLTGTNIKTIGSVKDTENNKIYWFVKADTKSIIAEYDEATNLAYPVLVDVYGILKFNENYLITGANIIDGLLFFTDNQTEPKKVNIEKFKAGSPNFSGHTQIYGRNFTEADVTVIKKKPNNAPKLSLFDSIGNDNTQSATSFNFSKNNGQDPVEVGEAYTVNILNTNREWKVGDILVFEYEQNSGQFSTNWEPIKIKGLITSYSGGATVFIEIVTASDNFVNEIAQYNVTVEQPNPLFELKFPRFGYRWKYEDGEYSVFSPFSEVAFLPGDIKYNAKDGYNEGMINTVRKILLYNFDDAPDNVEEVEILYKESNNNNVYTVEAVKKDELSSYNITSEIIYKVVENNQLLRAWDNVPKKAKAQEITANRLMYGNYTQGYNINTEPNINVTISSVEQTGASVKTDRTYQVGTVFEDRYGRQSPVIANQSGVIKLDRSASDKKNSISVKGVDTPPIWATKFKHYIKESSAPYYNVLVDKYYLNKDEPNSIWFSLPSSERNKITEDTYLILKKKHGADVAVDDTSTKYKILDIDNEAPNFLTDKFQSKGQINMTNVTTNLASDSSLLEANIESNEILEATIAAGSKIRFVNSANQSDIYTVSNVTFTDTNADEKSDTMSLTVNEIFNEVDINNFSSLTDYNIIFGEIETKVSPEFKNRFFIKLRIDSLLKQNIVNAVSIKVDNKSEYRIIKQETIKGDTYQNINSSCGFADLSTDDENSGYYWPGPGDPSVTPIATGSNKIYIRRTGQTYGDKNSKFDDFAEFLDAVGTKIRFESDPNAKTYEIQSSLRTGGDNGFEKGSFKALFGYDPLERICNYWVQWEITLDKNIDFTPNTTALDKRIYILDNIINEEENQLSVNSPIIFETEPEEVADLDLYYETEDTFDIAADWGRYNKLRWHNCFSFGNGVESDRIRDDFNGVQMGKGVRVSSVIAEQFKEEEKKNTIIFSGIYNSINGINQTNQFNQAEAITKDINPEYGSIQKLHARDGDLVALTEDKVLGISAGKDVLFNADGNPNLISSTNVLGYVRPYAGNFGISKNPESFAEYGNRFYFTDKARNVVLRFSGGIGGGDGLTVISNYGMSDYFKDLMKSNTGSFIGSFDEDLGTYNISIGDQTVGFNEMVKGWTSRYSFVPENGISLNANYFTFKNGNIWLHNVEDRIKNNFYNTQYSSKVTLFFNQDSSVVKKFKTLGYEGDEGWTANYIKTNLQEGSVTSFIDKEGKFFNYIKGDKTYLDLPNQKDNWDSKQFSSQGIGNVASLGGDLDITAVLMDAYIVQTIVEWRGDTYECEQV
jgi:hypothetical protein